MMQSQVRDAEAHNGGGVQRMGLKYAHMFYGKDVCYV